MPVLGFPDYRAAFAHLVPGPVGTAEPQLDHYWREVSFDQANVAGSVAHGWYDLPNEKAYYVNDSTRVANLQLLKEDCYVRR